MQVGTITSNSGCPAALEQVTCGSKKLCRKTVETGCSSVIFSTDVSYSKVRGRVYGYQKGTPEAFCGAGGTINGPYIDGVSITHGSSPRQHIWTLAATTSSAFCHCVTGSTCTVPSFVGTDYVCDVSGGSNTCSSADRLWDGVGCLDGAEECCEEANWFYKDLPPTTDDIEFRLCTDQSRADEDVYIEYVEIDVQ